ncbi:MAG: isochorismatase family cysteine hydrolase [Candidatus Thermoplasmatota archaeon]|nr:isochorismatase family cysteine hydrolase [Candidatus Thermoplasmatota archaeon]
MKALLVIDMLNDFLTGSLKCERAFHIVPEIKKVSDAFREQGLPVVYCNDAHIKGIDREISMWGEHAMAGTRGAEVIEELAPQTGDYIVPKRRYSCFFGTELDMLLRELGVDEVVLTGLHANLCVRHTAADAYFLGYGVTVLSDCTEALSQEDYDSGLEYIRKYYGAKVMDSRDLLGEL